jgi:hypothetical protein
VVFYTRDRGQGTGHRGQGAGHRRGQGIEDNGEWTMENNNKLIEPPDPDIFEPDAISVLSSDPEFKNIFFNNVEEDPDNG